MVKSGVMSFVGTILSGVKDNTALCETVMQVVVLEIIVMSDVVDDSAIQQTGAIEQCLPLVIGQSNSLQPQHHFTAKKRVRYTVLPTPAQHTHT